MTGLFLVIFWALGPLKTWTGCDGNTFQSATSKWCEVLRDVEVASAKHFNAGLSLLGAEICAAMTYYAAKWSNVLTPT